MTKKKQQKVVHAPKVKPRELMFTPEPVIREKEAPTVVVDVSSGTRLGRW